MRKIISSFIVVVLSVIISFGALISCLVNAMAESATDSKDIIVIKAAEYSSIEKDADISINDDVLSFKGGGSVTFSFDVNETGDYEVSLAYRALKGTSNNIELGMKTDGAFKEEGFKLFHLSRLWKNATNEISADSKGNEYSPEQIEAFEWQKSFVWDANGFEVSPLTLQLSKGKHTITLLSYSEPFELSEIVLTKATSLSSYSKVKEMYENNGYKNYSGKEIVVEGEKATFKSKKSLTPLSSRAEASILPTSPYYKKINYIGGSNWSQIGDTITWTVEAPETALYKIGFHFHQTYIQEGVSYRSLWIDGKIPFKEAESVPFGYKSGWQFNTLSSDNDDFLVYLTKGTHEISLRVTLGELSSLAKEIQNTVLEIGTIYRQIVMITGESPDSNRDYNLFSYIPDLEERLIAISKNLKSYADKSEEIYGLEGGSLSQIMHKVALIIDQMLETKFEAQNKKNALYDNYVSLSSWLFEMQNMALDLDCIVLTAPEKDFERGEISFFNKALYFVRRLLSSFADDYAADKNIENSITVWTSLGRDQVNVLSSLIDNDFSPKSNIDVDIKITTASLIQANLSGSAPDVELALARTAPVDYGMRGVLYDLTKFDDYSETVKRFSDSAMLPYEYKGAVYGLPVTQAFPMMFVRTDIFEELSLEIPKTWDELLLVAKILSLNNMEVGLSDSKTTLSMLTVQKDASFYNDSLDSTTFKTAKMQEIVTEWTDYYSKYSFPKTYSFFNRFRTGIMPLAIQNYSEYATVAAGAPEISNRWKMMPVPATVDENGKLNRSVCGSGTATAILKSTENPDAAWEFIKWWTSEDIQCRYSSGLESILGVSARVATANTAAMTKLGWDSETITVLNEQWQDVKEMPVVPGGYYVDRVIDQLYYNIVNGSQNVKQMLNKWGTEVDAEILRKTQQYAE